MNAAIVNAIMLLGQILFKNDENGISIFDRIAGVVKRWGQKTLEGTPEEVNKARRAGAIKEIANLGGFTISESNIRLGIELAVRLLKLKGA